MKANRSILAALLAVILGAQGFPVGASEQEGSDPGEEFLKGEVVVELKPGAEISAVNERNRTDVILQIYGTNFYRLGVPKNKSENKWRKRLGKDPDVLSAALNPVVTSPSVFARPTTSFPDGHATTGLSQLDFLGQQQLFALLKLDDVALRSRGAGAVVAVIDTGVDRSHPAFAGKLWTDDRSNGDRDGDGLDNDGDGLIDDAHGWDFVDNDSDPSEAKGDPKTTVVGHGTFIAGLISMLAPEATIMPIRAFPAEGIGDAFTVASAVKYAADHGAKVINLSLGSAQPSDLLQQAIIDARSRGITVTAAVGNDNTESSPQFPSTMDEVMAAAALDLDGHKTSFSNFGLHVDLSAPGYHLISAFPLDSGGPYARWSGTSFAAPLVAAEAALVISADPRNQQVRRVIEASADNIDEFNPGLAGKLGRGRINPLAALRSLNIGPITRAPSDFHSSINLARAPGVVEAAGTASIDVSGAQQEFTVEAQRLSVRSDYQLFVNGSQITRNTSVSLGSLRFAFSNESGPLLSPLNPVTGIRHVEIRDASNRVVLLGDFNPDAAAPTATVVKEARLAPAVANSGASGHSAITVQSLSNGSRREEIRIDAENLESGAVYRFLVDGINAGAITAQSGFARAYLASDGVGAQQLPPSLRPVTNIRRVEILNLRGELILQGSFSVTSAIAVSR